MTRPDIVLILADDLGYSDLGCYGGEISTPHLDALAARGARLTQFYNTARCSPSRASLLTGMHPHQTGIGVLTGDDSPVGYPGNLRPEVPTLAEMLSAGGYRTAAVGKWHLAADVRNPNASWPTRRGFASFYGTLTGCGSYYAPPTLVRGETNIEHEAEDPGFYYTDAITEEAVSTIERAAEQPDPLFLYVAYTAPHWPLHAPEQDIESCRGRYDEGWDSVREARLSRQKQLGILDEHAVLSSRAPGESAWDEVPDKEWQARRMETYAAMVERMDQGVGRIVEALEAKGTLENTVLVFLSDNGASPEELPHFERETFIRRRDIYSPTTREGADVHLGNEPEITPGPEESYASYGRPWANVSNTPFRMYKKWTHEGGIAAPFIVHWPEGGIVEGSLHREPLQLVHVAPTLLEAAGLEPDDVRAPGASPLEGSSFLSEVSDRRPVDSADDADVQERRGRTLYWEHCGNAAVRRQNWKLVREHGHPWELYDLDADPTEMHDLSSSRGELAQELLSDWSEWADRVGVLPFDRIEDLYVLRGRPASEAAG
jgi:arylsulfatase A-like enzyme